MSMFFVYDSLGNLMFKTPRKEVAEDHKLTFGNNKWKIKEK